MLTPQPPLDVLVDPAVNLNVTIVIGLLAALGFAWALFDWRRTKKPFAVILFAAGGCMMLMEPMVDTVGACWFPKNSWVGYEAWGRILPVWLCICYLMYFGVGVAVNWKLFQRGLTRGQVWTLFWVTALADTVLEETLMHFGAYYYYGYQPLILIKFPLAWAPVNSLITMVSAAVAFHFQDYFARGWRQFMLIPAMVSTSAAVNCMAGWPAWLVINTALPGWMTQAGGLVTCALCGWFMWMVVNVVAQESRATVGTRARGVAAQAA